MRRIDWRHKVQQASCQVIKRAQNKDFLHPACRDDTGQLMPHRQNFPVSRAAGA
jgi:hypothetical protein